MASRNYACCIAACYSQIFFICSHDYNSTWGRKEDGCVLPELVEGENKRRATKRTAEEEVNFGSYLIENRKFIPARMKITPASFSLFYSRLSFLLPSLDYRANELVDYR